MEQGGVSREAEGSEEEALADDGEARAMKKSKKKLVREQTLPLTIQWLRDTYEEKEGKTIGRYQVYDDYVAFCREHGHLATNNAALGKIFKRVFPTVGWRRLGKRGESKMHYANIRRKKNKENAASVSTTPDVSRTGLRQLEEEEYTASAEERAVTIKLEDYDSEIEEGDSESPVLGLCIKDPAHHFPRTPESWEDQWHRPNSHLAKKVRGHTYTLWNANPHLDFTMTIRCYRDRFRTSSWSLIPINPLSMKMRLLSYLFSTEEGNLERSSLSLSACVMLSTASLSFGHFDTATEFYHKAREHLSYVFDSTDYDVASALVPLSVLCMFFSTTPEQGRNRQVYYSTIGTQICEQLGALHDETYWSLLGSLHVKSMSSISDKIAKTRLYPRYKKPWKKTPLERGGYSRAYDHTADIFGTVYSAVRLLAGENVGPKEEQQAKVDLLTQLGRIREAESSMVRDLSSDKQVKDMMASFYHAVRTLIYVTLRDPKQIVSARELVRACLMADPPILVVIFQELASNTFLLLHTAIQVLARYRESKALKLLSDAILPFAARFTWMQQAYNFIQQAVAQFFFSQGPPRTASHENLHSPPSMPGAQPAEKPIYLHHHQPIYPLTSPAPARPSSIHPDSRPSLHPLQHTASPLANEQCLNLARPSAFGQQQSHPPPPGRTSFSGADTPQAFRSPDTSTDSPLAPYPALRPASEERCLDDMRLIEFLFST